MTWYKPRYKICFKFKSKIWSYKYSRLRNFIDRRGRQFLRKGRNQRNIRVLKNMKWMQIRRFFGTGLLSLNFKKNRKQYFFKTRWKYLTFFQRQKGYRQSLGRFNLKKLKRLYKYTFNKQNVYKYLSFLRKIELRFDILLNRLNFAITPFAAYFLLSKKIFLLNNHINYLPNTICQKGDIISINKKNWKIFQFLMLSKFKLRFFRQFVNLKRQVFKYKQIYNNFKYLNKNNYLIRFNKKQNYNINQLDYLNFLLKNIYYNKISNKNLTLLTKKKFSNSIIKKNLKFFILNNKQNNFKILLKQKNINKNLKQNLNKKFLKKKNFFKVKKKKLFFKTNTNITKIKNKNFIKNTNNKKFSVYFNKLNNKNNKQILKDINYKYQLKNIIFINKNNNINNNQNKVQIMKKKIRKQRYRLDLNKQRNSFFNYFGDKKYINKWVFNKNWLNYWFLKKTFPVKNQIWKKNKLLKFSFNNFIKLKKKNLNKNKLLNNYNINLYKKNFYYIFKQKHIAIKFNNIQLYNDYLKFLLINKKINNNQNKKNFFFYFLNCFNKSKKLKNNINLIYNKKQVNIKILKLINNNSWFSYFYKIKLLNKSKQKFYKKIQNKSFNKTKLINFLNMYKNLKKSKSISNKKLLLNTNFKVINNYSQISKLLNNFKILNFLIKIKSLLMSNLNIFNSFNSIFNLYRFFLIKKINNQLFKFYYLLFNNNNNKVNLINFKNLNIKNTFSIIKNFLFLIKNYINQKIYYKLLLYKNYNFLVDNKIENKKIQDFNNYKFFNSVIKNIIYAIKEERRFKKVNISNNIKYYMFWYFKQKFYLNLIKYQNNTNYKLLVKRSNLYNNLLSKPLNMSINSNLNKQNTFKLKFNKRNLKLKLKLRNYLVKKSNYNKNFLIINSNFRKFKFFWRKKRKFIKNISKFKNTDKDLINKYYVKLNNFKKLYKYGENSKKIYRIITENNKNQFNKYSKIRKSQQKQLKYKIQKNLYFQQKFSLTNMFRTFNNSYKIIKKSKHIKNFNSNILNTNYSSRLKSKIPARYFNNYTRFLRFPLRTIKKPKNKLYGSFISKRDKSSYKKYIKLKKNHWWYLPSFINFNWLLLSFMIINNPQINNILTGFSTLTFLKSFISFHKRRGF